MEPEELEHLLHRSRPRARPQFSDELEASLLGRTRPARPERRRPFALALGGGLALIAAAAVATLAGVGGLPGDDEPDVRARERCRSVNVVRTERVPVLVTRNGEPRIVKRAQKVRRQVRRCP